jgi:hypothetical protein
MVAITRKISDLTKPLRQALEAAAGASLADEQQVVIELPDASPSKPSGIANESGTLPDWCHVYDGLSESDLTSIDAAVSERAVMGRATQ